MISRLDVDYFRSLVSLYNLPESSLPEISSSESGNDVTETPESVWELPDYRLCHIGAVIILKVEAPNLETGFDNLLLSGPRLTFWKISPANLSKLLFCRLSVHRREVYHERMDQLERGKFNGQTCWSSAEGSEPAQAL
jgi:hypothetical protein